MLTITGKWIINEDKMVHSPTAPSLVFNNNSWSYWSKCSLWIVLIHERVPHTWRRMGPWHLGWTQHKDSVWFIFTTNKTCAIGITWKNKRRTIGRWGLPTSASIWAAILGIFTINHWTKLTAHRNCYEELKIMTSEELIRNLILIGSGGAEIP